MLAEPLRERMRGNELLELGDELGMARCREIGIDPELEHVEPELARVVRPRAPRSARRQIGERLAAEECEGLAQRRGSGRGLLLRGARAERLDLLHIGLTLLDPEQIPAASRLEPLRAELLAQLGHVHLHGLRRLLRRRLAPELVDEPIGRDRLVRVEQQHGEKRALLPPTEGERPLTGDDLERPEEAEVESVRPGSRPTLAGRSAPSGAAARTCRFLPPFPSSLPTLRNGARCQWGRPKGANDASQDRIFSAAVALVAAICAAGASAKRRHDFEGDRAEA